MWSYLSRSVWASLGSPMLDVIYAVPTRWFGGVSRWLEGVVSGSQTTNEDTAIEEIKESNRPILEGGSPDGFHSLHGTV